MKNNKRIDIYYVSSYKNINIKERFSNYKLEAFIIEMINLNNYIKNNQIIVNILISWYKKILMSF